MTAAPRVTHHPDQALLIAWAAGSLPEAHALTLAVHLELCAECRARLGALEALAGACLALETPAPLAQGACAAALTRAKAAPQERPAPPPPARGASGCFPAALRRVVGGDLEAAVWRPMGGGARQSIIVSDGRARARLLLIPPGAAMPEHGHGGLELTLVLKGSFSDAFGRFGRGDLESVGADVEHVPVAGPEGPCVCLASTDAPLRFKSLLPRIAQPFLRI